MTTWPHVPLRDVVKIERDIIEASSIKGGTLYVSLENIQSGGSLIDVTPVETGQLASSKFAFSPRHLLYGKLRPYLAKIARPDFSGICSTDILPLLPGPNLDRNYLAHFLLTPRIVALASSRATGANLPRLSPRVLEELHVPFPPVPEQKRIAEILDRTEALRAKRRAAVAQLKTLTQAIFLNLFGDPVVNPRQWPRKKLSEIGTVDRGVSKHRPRNAPELLGGPYPFVQTGDVANCDGYIRTFSTTYSEVGLHQSRLWPAGTLCITIAANIAKAGILTFGACFPDSVAGFRSDDSATVEFVRTWFSFIQASLEESAPESAQKNISLEILRNLDIPVPGIESQRIFAERVATAERFKESYRASLTELDALFASLQHRAFQGNL